MATPGDCSPGGNQGRNKMADASYAPKVYRRQGGNVLIVASGGEVNVESGGKITAAGTQASHIANAPAGGAGDPAGAYDTAAHRDAMIATINAILVALENAGILASS